MLKNAWIGRSGPLSCLIPTSTHQISWQTSHVSVGAQLSLPQLDCTLGITPERPHGCVNTPLPSFIFLGITIGGGYPTLFVISHAATIFPPLLFCHPSFSFYFFWFAFPSRLENLDELGNNGIAGLHGARVPAHVLRPQPSVDSGADGVLDGLGFGWEVQGVTQHHSHGEDGADRVDYSLATDVWRGP